MGIQFTWSHKRRVRKGERPWCSVVVPAAGNATRMEGTDKIMAEQGISRSLPTHCWPYSSAPMWTRSWSSPERT